MILPTHRARPPCRAGAVDPTRSGLAILAGARAHDVRGAAIHGGVPADACILTGARGLLRLPIDPAVTHITTVGGLRWP
jgi:hypothetical protein